jgi:hypothetical protein
MFFKPWAAACLTLATGLTAGLAARADAAVTSVQPQTIVQALQNGGYKAKLTKGDDGDPIIETASDGREVLIMLADCQDGRSCTTSEFVGVWDCSDAVEKCRAAAAAFNSQEQPTHVVLSDGGRKAVTYSYLIYDKVGVSEELFLSNFALFNHYNGKFIEAVAAR